MVTVLASDRGGLGFGDQVAYMGVEERQISYPVLRCSCEWLY